MIEGDLLCAFTLSLVADICLLHEHKPDSKKSKVSALPDTSALNLGLYIQCNNGSLVWDKKAEHSTCIATVSVSAF